MYAVSGCPELRACRRCVFWRVGAYNRRSEVHVSWKNEAAATSYEKHNGIKCLTCDVVFWRKTECRDHKGHDVVYLDAHGEVAR